MKWKHINREIRTTKRGEQIDRQYIAIHNFCTAVQHESYIIIIAPRDNEYGIGKRGEK